MIIEVLRSEHFQTFAPQAAQSKVWLEHSYFYIHGANLDGYAFVDDGRLLGAVGWFPRTEYMVSIWALFSSGLQKHSVTIIRFVNLLCNQLLSGKVHRIEANVEVGFLQGQRAMQVLGFEKEGITKAFGEGKEDYYLYSKVNYG